MNEPNTQVVPDIDSAFLAMLQMIRGGQVISDLSHAMRQVTTACRREGKPGAITLTIAFAPAGRSGALEFADDIKTKVPKSPKHSTLAFLDEDGALFRNDPNQQELPLRTIEGGAAVEVTTLKTVGAAQA